MNCSPDRAALTSGIVGRYRCTARWRCRAAARIDLVARALALRIEGRSRRGTSPAEAGDRVRRGRRLRAPIQEQDDGRRREPRRAVQIIEPRGSAPAGRPASERSRPGRTGTIVLEVLHRVTPGRGRGFPTASRGPGPRPGPGRSREVAADPLRPAARTGRATRGRLGGNEPPAASAY